MSSNVLTTITAPAAGDNASAEQRTIQTLRRLLDEMAALGQRMSPCVQLRVGVLAARLGSHRELVQRGMEAARNREHEDVAAFLLRYLDSTAAERVAE